MNGSTLYGLDTHAWLAEHRRRNAELIEAAGASRSETPRATAPRTVTIEVLRPAPALQPICC